MRAQNEQQILKLIFDFCFAAHHDILNQGLSVEWKRVDNSEISYTEAHANLISSKDNFRRVYFKTKARGRKVL